MMRHQSPAPESDAPPELRVAARALDRRQVLRLLAGSTGVVVGLLPLSACDRGPIPGGSNPAHTWRVLDVRGAATLDAVAARIVGADGAQRIASGTIAPAVAVDEILARSPELADPLRQALLVLEFGIWPLVAKWRPFTHLSGSAQDAVLADLESSSLDLKRAIFSGVKSLACVGFYGATASRDLTGYPGPFGLGSVSIADAMR